MITLRKWALSLNKVKFCVFVASHFLQITYNLCCLRNLQICCSYWKIHEFPLRYKDKTSYIIILTLCYDEIFPGCLEIITHRRNLLYSTLCCCIKSLNHKKHVRFKVASHQTDFTPWPIGLKGAVVSAIYTSVSVSIYILFPPFGVTGLQTP